MYFNNMKPEREYFYELIHHEKKLLPLLSKKFLKENLVCTKNFLTECFTLPFQKKR